MYSGMVTSHIKEMIALQAENRRVKPMYARLMHYHQKGRTPHRKIITTPCHKGELVEGVPKEQVTSVGRDSLVIRCSDHCGIAVSEKMMPGSCINYQHWQNSSVREGSIGILQSFFKSRSNRHAVGKGLPFLNLNLVYN